jgi:hypothetical protein
LGRCLVEDATVGAIDEGDLVAKGLVVPTTVALLRGAMGQR